MNRSLLVRIAARPRLFELILCLALAIPFAQFGAVAHALSHDGAERHSSTGEHKDLPQAGCDSCVGYSALGGTPPSAAPAPAVPEAQFASPAVPARASGPSPRVLAYSPRAPPSYLA